MADIRNRNLTLADCRFDWTMHGFESIFEGVGKFSDIDCVLNYRGRILVIENKFWVKKSGHDVPRFSGPQREFLYERLRDDYGFTCWYIAGDTKRSVPWFVEDLNSGISYDWTDCEPFEAQENLRELMREWKISIDAEYEGENNGASQSRF
jgi:hypothetical protein